MPIWCSLIFAENINAFPSKEDVRPETAGFAPFYWMENQCFPAAFRSDVHQEKKVDTLEGLQEEAKKFTDFFAAQGADQCGFCNPGYIVNIVALLRENPDPTDEEILEYLSGNLCRCTGYQSQLRSLRNYLNSKKEAAPLDLEAEVYGADIGREWKHE